MKTVLLATTTSIINDLLARYIAIYCWLTSPPLRKDLVSYLEINPVSSAPRHTFQPLDHGRGTEKENYSIVIRKMKAIILYYSFCLKKASVWIMWINDDSNLVVLVKLSTFELAIVFTCWVTLVTSTKLYVRKCFVHDGKSRNSLVAQLWELAYDIFVMRRLTCLVFRLMQGTRAYPFSANDNRAVNIRFIGIKQRTVICRYPLPPASVPNIVKLRPLRSVNTVIVKRSRYTHDEWPPGLSLFLFAIALVNVHPGTRLYICSVRRSLPTAPCPRLDPCTKNVRLKVAVFENRFRSRALKTFPDHRLFLTPETV